MNVRHKDSKTKKERRNIHVSLRQTLRLHLHHHTLHYLLNVFMKWRRPPQRCQIIFNQLNSSD